MSKREMAIDKLEGWARWETGSTRESVAGSGPPVSSGFLPGDQADHLTVELALKAYEGARLKANGLRMLLLHIYGRDLSTDAFDPLLLMPVPEGRGLVRAFLGTFGWRPESFAHVCAQRFVRFLGERL